LPAQVSPEPLTKHCLNSGLVIDDKNQNAPICKA
jgi:hypothetical protein